MTEIELAKKLNVPNVSLKSSVTVYGPCIELFAGDVRIGTGVSVQEARDDAEKNGFRALKKKEFRDAGLSGADLVAAVDKAVEEIRNA